MNDEYIHKSRRAIFETLRHNADARYSELLQASKSDPELFRYHIKRLTYQGFIQKNDRGRYSLTIKGKQFSNQLGDDSAQIRIRPSVSFQIALFTSSGKVLLQKRQRHPYYGFSGLLSGPLEMGDDLITSAQRELHKQTGIEAKLERVAIFRQLDRLKNGVVVGDHLFYVLTATALSELPPTSWSAGSNFWIDQSEVDSLADLFPATIQTLENIQNRKDYWHRDNIYDLCQY